MMTANPARLGGLLLSAIVGVGCGAASTTSTDNCASDPRTCVCTDDSKCSDPVPRCETRTSKCVPCLPTADNCPLSQHCIFTSDEGFHCVAKDACGTADDCSLLAGKAQLCCGGKCADRYNDANNCGTCGKVCDAVANANTGCVTGSCKVTMCKAGLGDCDGKIENGCESDVTNDIAHCGACETPCPKAPNAALRCEASQCSFTCNADFADCDGNKQNGCETSTSTNPANCGACGKVCGSLPNTASVACAAGACVVETCNPGFADCNKNAADGCESDSGSDVNNCAGCGKRCPAVMNGTPGCLQGSCGVGKCQAGFGDCDGNVLNGCEQDLTADARNCGACGNVCMAPNAVLACQAGMCQLQSCNNGFSDCDNNVANGCEAIVSRDLKNCGACGVVCPVPQNATASCSAGVCGVGSCMYGWGDCNKDIKDGCETNLLQTSNCGACGNVCPALVNASVSCKNAVCAINSCNPGFLDCDMKAANGCEVNALTDSANCSGCGSVCMPVQNQSTVCTGGKCVLGACVQGFGDCNKNPNDGCEAELGKDPLNCAACGMVCPPQAKFCINGVCSVQQIPCSTVALNWCMQKGWTVPQGGQAAGGRLYCTKNIGTGSDCNTCNDYNMIVWTAGAKPLYCQQFNYSTVAGRVYAGHNPCACGDNLFDCGVWDMMGCTPD